LLAKSTEKKHLQQKLSEATLVVEVCLGSRTKQIPIVIIPAVSHGTSFEETQEALEIITVEFDYFGSPGGLPSPRTNYIEI